MSLLAWIVVGLVAGWLASLLTGTRASLLTDLLVGILGAILGGVLFRAFGAAGATGINLYSILVAVVGATILLWIYHAVSARGALRP
ncbi:MAG: GlsB/YeaQ/YmgE family stress response membrane protein [Candidatus Sericytochromatia bacterium]|nr:GlsB/YeaQ/YmgE family stress response membrane protein [Candidatus Tanganyikabacteria bacterium]